MMKKPNESKWFLRILQHNMFLDYKVVQVWYDDEIRGSFTLHEEDKDGLEYWTSRHRIERDIN